MKAKTRGRVRRVIAWGMLGFSVVGWPLTAFTVAKGEPPVILGLSWLALLFTAIDGILVAEE